MKRTVALLSHDKNPEIIASASRVAQALKLAGVDVFWLPTLPSSSNNEETELLSIDELARVELIIVMGGDGTILRAAELAYGHSIPILGINYGHMGFLAEADPESIAHVVSAIEQGQWTVESRMAVQVTIETADGDVTSSWALNEASIEKDPVSRMVEADIAIDQVPVSAFSCDTVLVSTPTGSTAYSFSAGGPVVWPDVDALVVTPVAAHALFARPLVVSPDSRVSVTINSNNAHVWCDGRRLFLHLLAQG